MLTVMLTIDTLQSRAHPSPLLTQWRGHCRTLEHLSAASLCTDSTTSVSLLRRGPGHSHVLCVPDCLKSQSSSKGSLRTR